MTAMDDRPVVVADDAGTADLETAVAPAPAVEDDAIAEPGATVGQAEAHVAAATADSEWTPSQWHGSMLVDAEGKRLGKLEDVYVDVETDQPMFATVKQGLWPGRHLTFVPLRDVHVEPDVIRVPTSADRVSSGPDLDLHGEELTLADEAALYHHFQLNYEPLLNPGGRRLARR